MFGRRHWGLEGLVALPLLLRSRVAAAVEARCHHSTSGGGLLVLGRRHWGLGGLVALPLLLRSRVAADPAAPCWLVVVQPAGGGAGPVAAAAPPAPSIQPDRNWSLPVGEPVLLPLMLPHHLERISPPRAAADPSPRSWLTPRRRSPSHRLENNLLKGPPLLLHPHTVTAVVVVPRRL